MNTDAYIEALLFVRGEPVRISELSRSLSCSNEDIEEHLKALEERLSGGGVRLMRVNDKVSLVSAPEASAFLSALAGEDMTADIGKAGMEVLTIILHLSPVSRRHIDYIRGVNSASALRLLLVKGLVERASSPSGHGYVYKPTADLLAFLGVTSERELPEYDTLRYQLSDLLGDKDTSVMNKEKHE